MRSVRSICVVGGGGPAGSRRPSVVTEVSRHLLAEKHFTKIDLIEQRADVGGVWNYVPENDGGQHIPVPSTSPNVPLEKPKWRDGKGSGQTPTFQSPLYDRLEANLPKMLMQHSDQKFPDDNQLFPTHEQITQYLESYANEIRDLVKFKTQVLHIEPKGPNDDDPSWSVTTQNLQSQQEETNEYDAVVMANGHYTLPFIPEYDSISLWHKDNPGIISHSKFFRRPEDFRHKKVLTIGYGPSGQDIARQISHYAAELYMSTRTPIDPSGAPPGAKLMPGIASFEVSADSDRSIRFVDGQTISNFDAVLFCTGYIYSYPMFPRSMQPPIITTGSRVQNVYQHLLYTAIPTLAFLTLPWNIVPFPVAEVQGAVVARLWSGRLKMPSRTEMDEWERRRISQVGDGKAFHKLAPPQDINYINDLCRWAEQADGQMGKQPPYWGPWRRWMRLNVGNFRRTFQSMGEARHEIRTLEELGFRYDGPPEGEDSRESRI